MKKIIGTLCIVGILLATAAADAKAQSLATPFQTWDVFQNELVERARSIIGISNDFDIRVTDVAAPVGTLFRPGTSIQIDVSKCTMLTPNKSDLPSLYPAYSLDRSLGVNLGLNEGVLGQLSQFGVRIRSGRNLGFRVDDPTIRHLTDTDMQALLGNNSCASVIPESGAMLVRGYVSGKRIFSIVTSRNGELNAGQKVIGNLTFTATSNNSIQAADNNPRDFIQILAFVRPQNRDNKGREQLALLSVADAIPQSEQGTIYIQKDSRDTSSMPAQLKQSFANKGFSVASGVEAISPEIMPSVSQVRYFNESDLEIANSILDILQHTRPNAEIKKLGLRAPKGQVEVWLTFEQ